jgi:hypothetical protein
MTYNGCSGASDEEEPCMAAAAKGDLQTIKSYSPLSKAFSIQLINAAAFAGHRNIIEYLHDVNQCSPNAMDWAAKGNHLDLIKWLEYNCSCGCTTNAIDWAAELGYFDIVSFIVHHNIETIANLCTTKAVDQAAKNGHLDIVKLLLDSGAKCTTWAMDYAARNGHLDVLKCLARYKQECTHIAINGAAENGHFETVQWLYKNYPEKCDVASAIGHAKTYRQEKICLWLQQNCILTTGSAASGTVIQTVINPEQVALCDRKTALIDEACARRVQSAALVKHCAEIVAGAKQALAQAESAYQNAVAANQTVLEGLKLLIEN